MRLAFVAAVVVAGHAVAFGGVAAAGPTTGDLCSNAPVLSEGSYSDTISPDGVDLYRPDIGTDERY